MAEQIMVLKHAKVKEEQVDWELVEQVRASLEDIKHGRIRRVA